MPAGTERASIPIVWDKGPRKSRSRHRLTFAGSSSSDHPTPWAQLRVSTWDRHPSALGHRALFQALRAELLRRGLLPGLELGTEVTDPGDGNVREVDLSPERSLLPRKSRDWGFRLKKPIEICPDLIKN
jgi:hypothetical protein